MTTASSGAQVQKGSSVFGMVRGIIANEGPKYVSY